MSVTFYPNLIQYSGFDAAAEPSISGQVATMSGGETSGPLYDLLDNRRTNTLSLDTNGETTTAVIQTETTSSISCNFAIIDNHNMKSADSKYSIDQGVNTVAISLCFSGTLGSELSADSETNDIITVGADGISICRFSEDSGTVWKLNIDDVATFDDDVTLGEFILGKRFSPAHNPELQPIFGYDMPGSSFRESEGNQKYGFSKHTSDRRSWRLMWEYMSDSDKEKLEDVFFWTRGVKFPFYIDLGSILGATNPQLYYVRFMRKLIFKGLTTDAWQVTIDIEEEI